MGIFDIFRSKRINNEKFHSLQFQNEILAFALWKYKENNNDYSKVKIELSQLKDVSLNEKQTEIIIEKLKIINNIETVQVGQVWKYKTRIDEEKSRVTIFKIDYFNGEEIIHLTVDHLKIRKTENSHESMDYVGHIPLSKNAFLNSITNLENQLKELPQIEEGYYDWKQAHDSGKAGVFDIEIKEVINYIEQTLQQ